jgi:DNA-binding transcriptional LysR family regulator
MMLIRDMAKIVARCDGLRSTSVALSRGTEPIVRILVDQPLDIARVAKALAEFRSLLPATRVEVATECMEAVVRQVEDGFDLGVPASLATVPAHIASKTIKPIRPFLIAAAGGDGHSSRHQRIPEPDRQRASLHVQAFKLTRPLLEIRSL